MPNSKLPNTEAIREIMEKLATKVEISKDDLALLQQHIDDLEKVSPLLGDHVHHDKVKRM